MLESDDSKKKVSKLAAMKKEVEIKKDNTLVKKVLPDVKKIDYKYLGSSEDIKGMPTSKDSADYREGFKEGYKKPEEPKKSFIPDIIDMKSFNEKEKENLNKEGLIWRSLNRRYNEGFSEGKDQRLKNKNKK